MNTFHRRFHDSQFNAQVEEALAFVDTLGLDGGDARHITVVPEERLSEALLSLRVSPRVGDYDPRTGEVFATAQSNFPGQPGSAALRLGILLAHELGGHKGTIRGIHERAISSDFALEAVAGMAEVAFWDSLVASGEREQRPDRVIELAGRTVLPKGRHAVWKHKAVMPAGYLASLPYQDGGPSEGPLAAWSLSLAAQVSGIEPAEIFAAAADRSSNPFKLVVQSAVALAPDAASFIRSQANQHSGVRAVANYLYEAALAQGIVTEPEPLPCG